MSSHASPLIVQLQALLQGETDPVANAANFAALCWLEMADISWVGFYFVQSRGKEQELVLGPFQGKPACARIAWGAGVCGTAAATASVQVVADVHAFPGHIACDPDSASELVLPILDGDKLLGVLDIDSSCPGRFGPTEVELMQGMLQVYLDSLRQELAPAHRAGGGH